MYILNNNEYMILSLVWESKTASGYQINATINNRGYREWADVGMTSIYKTLKKLEQKNLLDSHITMNKTTQGPAAREYSITENGRLLLKEETEKGLSETRERDRRFDLALSVINIMPMDHALTFIEKRKLYLENENERLTEIYTGQKQRISFNGALLFKHTLHFMQSEIKFLKELISQWGEITHGN
ncbi:MAG: PadR family transcriptional regulator [Bacillota bacterium]|nr:PadR family transcriptional regulator [Bacillota bacterium]